MILIKVYVSPGDHAALAALAAARRVPLSALVRSLVMAAAMEGGR